LHYSGKIGIPDAVLNKPERRTELEFTKIREHPGMGRRILEPLIDQEEILAMTLCHHERWDGGGYPMGLSGNDIPEPARLLAIADTLDAVTSWRAYRDARSWELAVAEIRSERGRQFDPQMVDLFESTLESLAALYRELRR
jgi:putative two-component system response regulator